jgi:RNA polymerase sigma-70 factor (ECF subfamily)
MDNERDEYLMARVGGDRPELLEKLLRRHANPLLTFLQRMVGDPHRGEELFQEVFLAVWIKRRQYQFPRPFKPWLYAIAVNKCRAWFRRRTSPPIPLDVEDALMPAAPDASPADAAIATETAVLVNQAIQKLPHQQRAVVMLRVWEDLSYAQIAESIGCSEPTARSHMHHGLAALRKYLEPYQ